MGSSRNAQLNASQKTAETNYASALTEAKKMTPAELMLLERNTRFINELEAPGLDITKVVDLKPYLQIGAAERERRGRQRMGTGALQLSGVGSDGYAAKLRQQSQDEAAANFGTGLEQAVAGRYAEATGSLLPVAQLGMQRQGNILGSTQAGVNMYLNAPRETPFWKQLTMAAISGGAQVGAALAGKPSSDIRVKSFIQQSPYGLKDLLKLNSVKYVKDGKWEIGLIAQQVEEFMPEFVGERPDGTKTLDYALITSVLIQAIQELEGEVASLREHAKQGCMRKLLSSLRSWLKSKL